MRYLIIGKIGSHLVKLSILIAFQITFIILLTEVSLRQQKAATVLM